MPLDWIVLVRMEINYYKNIYVRCFLSIVLCSSLCIGLTSCKKEEKIASFDVQLPANNLKTVDLNDLEARAKGKVNTAPKVNETKENLVVVNIGNYGRLNPFVPYNEKNLLIQAENNVLTDIPSPPRAVEQDPNVSALMQAKVAGILYDGEKSSAIINVSNTDHLVHKGDTINEFYIEDITKDKVTLKYGFNEYKAGVGEIIEGRITNNDVYNIEERFAGKLKAQEAESFININYLVEESAEVPEENVEQDSSETNDNPNNDKIEATLSESSTIDQQVENEEIEEIPDPQDKEQKKIKNKDAIIRQMREKILN